jgi:Carboxylesterase family
VLGDGWGFSRYDGMHLALNENVIVVARTSYLVSCTLSGLDCQPVLTLSLTANYRLGSFGFMALNELAKESGGTTGNYALQDQT